VAGVAEGPGVEMRLGGRPCEGDDDSFVFTQLPTGSTRLYPVILWVDPGH
jgi:hypothetical protein